ncbi:Zn-dependent peptidase ImmA, M78 family [Novosphingobium sp. CF614]|uniref:helix-turn-helix domain-containing protein n=1 Tax=Novosphingobium sp. CF614 TaxID=1884364 RepID=UPI0008E53E34|nr:XRE family transcriptional regulator [Novosphingobium sp. CF614]SFG52942.1 Zn-dependent peptidase ImmA, M78 family [Novosphingobium sp. CF614]
MDVKSKIAGEQLRLARLAHGYSLEEVGALIGATRQFIHQLETGSRSASDETVEALADVLGVTPAFLSEPIPSTVRPEQCHFRGHITRPASVTSQVLARGTLLDKFVAAMEQHLDLPDVSFPDIPATSMEEIERAAEEARCHWGLGTTGPITSMMRVVENAGAIVTYFGDLSDRIDAFSMDRRRPIIVRSSLKESLCRQRFDFAHECGHLIMHRGLQTGDRATEDQAHRFASAFLFPRGAVLREFPRGSSINWRALYDLKLRWKMSVRALIRRGHDLKLLTPAQYRTANIHLVKAGQAKVEKYDDDGSLPVEQPELLASAIEALDYAVYGGVGAVGDEVGLSSPMLELITGMGIPEADPGLDSENVIRLRR